MLPDSTGSKEQEGYMHVTVKGKKVEVAVSEGGMFHDVATKTISATTLKGLEKKMRTAIIPKTGVPIERVGVYTPGVVLSRVASKGWRKSQFVVRWADGSTTEESGYSLGAATTKEQREEIKRLADEALRLSKLAAEAATVASQYKYKVAHIDIDSYFPLS